jgi:hypothetical protein
MKLAGLVIAGLVLLFGLRLIGMALQAAITGKVLIRRGWQGHWQKAPTRQDALKTAFRDGLMGALLLGLSVALLT